MIEPCSHMFCEDCVRDYLEFYINNGKVNQLNCPLCKVSLSEEFIRNLLGNKSDYIAKYEKFKKNQLVYRNPMFCYCPNKSCSKLLTVDTLDYQIKCGYCYYDFCFLTKQPWHLKQSCTDHLEGMYSLAAKGKPIQMCPFCNLISEKSKNCNHMTCNMCMKSYCMFCRQEFKSNHMSPFHAFICSADNQEQSKLIVND